MSRLLILQNQLKKEARYELLIDQQRRAFDYVTHAWRFPERLFVLGAAGCGKTFLGWALARGHGATHYASPEDFTQSTSTDQAIVVDNVYPEPKSLRWLLSEMQLRQIRRAVMISRYESTLGLPIFALDLPSSDEISVVYHNLSLLEYYALEPLTAGNLWAIIHSTLR